VSPFHLLEPIQHQFLVVGRKSPLTLNDDHINLCQSECSSRNLGMDLKISAIRPYMEKGGEY
jgi:hypothetical protein